MFCIFSLDFRSIDFLSFSIFEIQIFQIRFHFDLNFDFAVSSHYRDVANSLVKLQ